MDGAVSRRHRSTELSWTEVGDPSGAAVVYFHGTAKSHEDIPFPEVAARLELRLMMADRPGYGGSAARPGASFSDISRIVLSDLDALGVAQFSLLGWSGGGPHALACADAAPSRVSAVGLLGSWAPMNPPDRGLPVGVRFAMRVAAALPRPALQLMFLFGRHSSSGMIDDVRRVARPWRFRVEHVASSVRVIAWHAEGDRQVPVAPWREINGIALKVVSGASHDPSIDLWEVALRTVATGAE
jgi:pimeloyl-ACP methyl ester carboxylesterase